MSKSPIELREAQRDAYCRGCDEVINRGEQMVSTYSFRNRGQHIHFCMSCADDIGGLVHLAHMRRISSPVRTRTLDLE